MKKINVFFISIVVALLLVGCGDNNNVENNGNLADGAIGTVTIELTKDSGEEEIGKDEVDLFAGDSVIDVMERNYDLDTGHDGAFIQGIDGLGPDEEGKYFWIYTVNDEEVLVGAGDYELEVGDLVQFDYAAWE